MLHRHSTPPSVARGVDTSAVPQPDHDLRFPERAPLRRRTSGEQCSTATAHRPREGAVRIGPQFHGPITAADPRSEGLLDGNRSGEQSSITAPPPPDECCADSSSLQWPDPLRVLGAASSFPQNLEREGLP